MKHPNPAPAAAGSSGSNTASTPGRPHDTSRQQKHDDQNLDSGSDSLDKRSSRDSPSREAPTPPGAK